MKSNNQKIARFLAGKKLPSNEVKAIKSIMHNRRKLITPFHVEGTPFPVGRKQVFLPNFEIALLRNPKNPPTWAEFQVPLNINKLDLRDYLFNAYNIHAKAIRVEIDQPEVKQRRGDYRPTSWYQPRSTKRMVVEMDKPFVWPEEPKNLDAWDKKTRDAAKEFTDEYADSLGNKDLSVHPQDKVEIMASKAELAERLVSGEAEWKGERIFQESETNRISVETGKKAFRRRI